MEKAYDFRKKLLMVHEADLRDKSRLTKANEYLLEKGRIKLSKTAGNVMKTAAYDFADFLQISMQMSATVVREGDADITVMLAEENGVDLGEYAAYMGFKIDSDEAGICIYAHDERGAAQALYYIEDKMSFARAPLLEHGTIYKKALFTPRMVHSGYGLDDFPDEYLARVAHDGRDAILVFAKGVHESPIGHVDFNDLIQRAAKYGIDVYAYSYYKSRMSPYEPEAEAYYDDSYGRLFRECPGLKGVVLVGESVEFPSKDSHVAPGFDNMTTVDNIPTGKRTSGWYPCFDYPVWLSLLKKVIYKYNPAADIVFWTYNWGCQPEEERVKLIESLPTDISLLATFEMFEPRNYGDSKAWCQDYTLAFEGPGKYFTSEAVAAKKRGVRLYSMTNTGGLTWDFGVVPYEPMPQQWIRRYQAMEKAAGEWGLIGIMESHHYGMYPSFISKLSKLVFMVPHEPMDDILRDIIRSYFGEENYEKTDAALKLFSEAIRYYTPGDADQYGAFRVGPSYPLNLFITCKIPASEKAMFGNRICNCNYSHSTGAWQSPLCLRINPEIRSLEKMLGLMEQGVALLVTAEAPNEKLLELTNLTQFMVNCVKTGLCAKQWYILKCLVRTVTTPEELEKILEDMEKLILTERKNVESTIPLVEYDSRLGWEPSMHYMTDRWHLEWKLRQLDYLLDTEIFEMRGALEKHLS